MPTPAQTQITTTIKDSIKSKPFMFMFGLRALTAFFPLISTYLFSRVIASIETHATLLTLLCVIFAILVFQHFDNLLRLYSKTRIEFMIIKISLLIQTKLLDNLSEKLRSQKEIVQACVNLTNSVNALLAYIKETGITGLVYFVAVPAILFFIDIRIFVIELVFILIYLFFTLYFNKKYEKLFESYNQSREHYFANIFAAKDTSNESVSLLSKYLSVQNFTFLMWLVFQNSVAIFQFIVLLVVILDIFNGTKHISDLVLIVGYTRESQAFLNEFSTSYERLMEVDAGVERLEKDLNS